MLFGSNVALPRFGKPRRFQDIPGRPHVLFGFLYTYIYNYTYIYIYIYMYVSYYYMCNIIWTSYFYIYAFDLRVDTIMENILLHLSYIYGIILPNWRTPWFFRGVVIPPNSVTGGFLLWSGIMRIMHWKSYYISNSRHLFFHRPPQPRQGVAWRRPGLLGLDASVTGWRWPWLPQEMSRKWWIHGEFMVNSWWFNGEFMVI